MISKISLSLAAGLLFGPMTFGQTPGTTDPIKPPPKPTEAQIASENYYAGKTTPNFDLDAFRKAYQAQIVDGMNGITSSMAQGGSAGNGFGNNLIDGSKYSTYFEEMGVQYDNATISYRDTYNGVTAQMQEDHKAVVQAAIDNGKPLTAEEENLWLSSIRQREYYITDYVNTRSQYRNTYISGSEEVASTFTTQDQLQENILATNTLSEDTVRDGTNNDLSRNQAAERLTVEGRTLGDLDQKYIDNKQSSDPTKESASTLGIVYTSMVPTMGATDDSLAGMLWNPSGTSSGQAIEKLSWTAGNSPNLSVTNEGDLTVTPPLLPGLSGGMTTLTSTGPVTVLVKDIGNPGDGSGTPVDATVACKCCGAPVSYQEWVDNVAQVNGTEYWYCLPVYQFRRILDSDSVWDPSDPLWMKIRVKKFNTATPLLYSPRNSVEPRTVEGGIVTDYPPSDPPAEILASLRDGALPTEIVGNSVPDDVTIQVDGWSGMFGSYRLEAIYPQYWYKVVLESTQQFEVTRRGYLCTKGHDQSKSCPPN